MSNRNSAVYRGSTAVGRSVQLFLYKKLSEMAKIVPDLDHPDPTVVAEAVHDLRVACQQMRSVLQAFSGFLPPESAEKFDTRLRRLQRRFREVRDQYILLAQPDLVPDLRSVVAQAHDKAMRRLLTDPGSHGFTRKLEKLCRQLAGPEAEILFSPEPLDRKGYVQARRLDAVLPSVLYRQAAAVTAYRAFIPETFEPDAQAPAAPGSRFWENPDWPDPVLLHRLRLTCKQFRHLLIMQNPLWGELGDSLTAACKHLQDLLGHFHDRQLLAEALYEYGQTAAGREAVAAVWPDIQKRHEADLQAFMDAWKGMDFAWFQQQMHPLVHWCAGQAAGSEDCGQIRE